MKFCMGISVKFCMGISVKFYMGISVKFCIGISNEPVSPSYVCSFVEIT